MQLAHLDITLTHRKMQLAERHYTLAIQDNILTQHKYFRKK